MILTKKCIDLLNPYTSFFYIMGQEDIFGTIFSENTVYYQYQQLNRKFSLKLLNIVF